MKLKNWLSSICLGASLAALAAGPANARDIKLGEGLPPAHPVHHGLEVFAKTVKEKSAGELDVKIYPQALLNLSQMFAGVRDGVVDMGYVLPPLFPSELPEVQLPIDLAMLGSNGYAMAGAMTEYNLSCQECLGARLKNNQVYLGSASTDTYLILSTKKITTLDELKGKKLRSAAGPWARWANHFGAVAVSMTANEVFEAISQGTVDGTMVTPTELASMRLIDLVKHITTSVPSGTYHGQDIHNMNRNTWRSLSEAQRRMVLDASAMSAAAATWRFVTDASRSMGDAQKKGIQVHQPAPDLLARSKAYIESDLATVAQTAEKNHGIKDASQKVARFRALVEKWERLTPMTGNWDTNSLAEVYRREIFSKIDAKTYGM